MPGCPASSASRPAARSWAWARARPFPAGSRQPSILFRPNGRARALEIGFFFRGLVFDRFALSKDRPVFMFFLLALLMIPFGFTGVVSSSAGVLALFFWCMFVTGGFQMLGLRTGARAYPGAGTASVAGVASGAWAAEAALIQPIVGRWFDQAHYDWIFWSIALIPLAGVLIWTVLSRKPLRSVQL